MIVAPVSACSTGVIVMPIWQEQFEVNGRDFPLDVTVSTEPNKINIYNDSTKPIYLLNQGQKEALEAEPTSFNNILEQREAVDGSQSLDSPLLIKVGSAQMLTREWIYQLDDSLIENELDWGTLSNSEPESSSEFTLPEPQESTLFLTDRDQIIEIPISIIYLENESENIQNSQNIFSSSGCTVFPSYVPFIGIGILLIMVSYQLQKRLKS